jgi:hypothetical protein
MTLASGCGAREAAAPPRPCAPAVAGLYWGRWAEVPEGMRVAVWLHEDGATLRGSWDLPPWHGEIDATRTGDRYVGRWRQEGTVAVQQMQERVVVLAWDARTQTLREEGGGAEGADLRRAGQPGAPLRPGLWLGRWTGLPTGVAVETLLTPLGDGRWRATYRYQEREGTFDGDVAADGALTIHWREVSPHDVVASGRGRLLRSLIGYRGTYGVGDRESGTGLWTLEAWRTP